MHCCIPGCTSTPAIPSKLNNVKFYRFPTNSVHMPWLCEKRLKWIKAVQKHTKHSSWLPSKSTIICSAHFIGNKKSENPTDPSYIPTIFPEVENNTQTRVQKLQKFDRHQHRIDQAKFVKLYNNSFQENSAESDVLFENLFKRSIGCQCDNLLRGDQTDNTSYFICNLTSLDGVCTAEVQVNIVSKMLVNKSCEANITTTLKVKRDSSCDPLDQDSQMLLCQGFHGITSIKTEEDLMSKMLVNKSCEANITTTSIVKKDSSCDPLDQDSQMLLCQGFHGITSIKTEEDLMSKMLVNKNCEANITTTSIVKKDSSCDPLDQDSQMLLCQGFHGITSIKKEEDLMLVNKSCEANIATTSKVKTDSSCDPLEQDSQMLLCQGFHGITSIKKEEDLMLNDNVDVECKVEC